MKKPHGVGSTGSHSKLSCRLLKRKEQKMNRYVALYSLLAAFAAAFDLASTYLVSPNLVGEMSTIFILWGRGDHAWARLITVKGVVSILAIMLFYIGLMTIERRRHRFDGRVSIAAFLGLLFFREKAPLRKLFKTSPLDFGSVGGFFCLAMAMGVICSGLVAGLCNLLRIISSWYLLIGFWIATGILSCLIAVHVARTVLMSSQAVSVRRFHV